MAISSFYGLEGAPIIWEGIPVLPGLGGQFGDDWLLKHAERFFGGDAKDGIVVTLMDVWVLDPSFMRKMNCAAWVPVDHEPVPQKVVNYFTNSGAVPIAMSRFGERMLGRLDPLYVPHAVDCKVYQPHDRKAMRELVGIPEDTFVVGMVAANKGRPSRKGFVQAFQAFAKFLETHENSILYLHTMMSPQLAGGGPPGAAGGSRRPAGERQDRRPVPRPVRPLRAADDGEDLRLARRAAEPGDR
jgi:hypothetical protein